MLDSVKIGKFISTKRKERGLSQQQLADTLNVSFQAISKWENGAGYPNIETLYELATYLETSVDDILTGRENVQQGLSYSKAGVDITYTDSIKKDMEKHLKTKDRRVLNGLGAFASLYDINFPELKEPVLALKSEEPGSKQKLAIEYGYTESICHDMINHLVNDTIAMGAKPLAVLDTIVCGKAERDTIQAIVRGISDACKQNDCSLVGGETSIQPSVIDSGVYVLTSSMVGIVEKSKIVDGSHIEEGDIVLAIASNGLHTNGYSMVRMLMDKKPEIKLDKIEGITFIEQIMKPHTPYYTSIKEIMGENYVHGMAHITGGGIEGNLCRIIPEGLAAEIDISKIQILEIFKYIKKHGKVADEEMLRTFNMGVGYVLVVKTEKKDYVINAVSKYYNCYEIGTIRCGKEKIQFINELKW